MLCPRCQAQSAILQDHCPQCGLDFSPIRRLIHLRNDVVGAGSQVESLAQRIKTMQDSIQLIQSELVTGLLKSREQQARTPTLEQQVLSTRQSEAAQERNDPPPVSAVSGPSFSPQVPPRFAERLGDPVPELFDSSAELRLGQKWLLIVGIAVMVLGVGYFLKYAFDQNWIGPAGRVALAYAGGTACLVLGEMFRRKGLTIFGLYLCGGGVAVLYFSGYASFQIYHLIGQPVAFLLMVAVTALAGYLSLVHDVKWLAVLGIIGGFLTPMVLSTRQDNQIALMSYMTILNGGIVAIAFHKRWGLLNSLGFAATWLLFFAWHVRHYAPEKFLPTLTFLNVFFVVYALVPFAYYFVRSDSASQAGYVITGVNAAIAFGLSFAIVREFASLRSVSFVSIGYAALYFYLALQLRKRNPHAKQPFVLLVAMGTLFLVVTVPVLFSGHWITVFWTIQGLALLWASIRINDNRMLSAGVVLILVGAAKYFCWDQTAVYGLDYSDLRFRSGFAITAFARWTTIVTILAVSMAGALTIGRGRRSQDIEAFAPAKRLLFAVFGIFFFLALNIEACAFFVEFLPGARLAAISVLWALFAIVLMLLGFARSNSALRMCSLVLFGVALIKVFLYDMANVRTPYRIISFLVLGLMLIGASYLYHRYRARMAPLSAGPET
jgi:uncharacterized membrane protein